MTKTAETTIDADPKLPIIRITRDFAATPEQLFRANTDPVLFAQWVGPDALDTRIEHWAARTGGSWRFVQMDQGVEYAFRGCFHEVRPDRIVQLLSAQPSFIQNLAHRDWLILHVGFGRGVEHRLRKLCGYNRFHRKLHF